MTMARRQRSRQYAKGRTTFLMWSAEPHMEDRKRLGLQVFVFLIIFTGLMYFTRRRSGPTRTERGAMM